MGLEELGYLGLFIAGFLAATILPFSSESLLAVALLNGFDPIICLIIITSGNWLGSITTYGIGYLGNVDWIEKYFKINVIWCINVRYEPLVHSQLWNRCVFLNDNEFHCLSLSQNLLIIANNVDEQEHPYR